MSAAPCADYSLPAGFFHTGNLALIGQLTEADTANAVVAQVSVGSTTNFASVVVAAGELRRLLLL